KNTKNDSYKISSENKETKVIDAELRRESETFYEVPVGSEETDKYGLSSENPPSEDAPYDFEWAIVDSESGNSFSHVESRDSRSMQGQYRVLLPDGRTQVVRFYDDGNGYHADVTYER
ncbi:unnamed protein product, partial [Meganyctiphanes norvegica]